MRTGIYVRVSTEEQAKEGYSIRGQQEKLTDYARIKDWSIFDLYVDEGISGKNVTERPEINRLLKDIEKGKIENVLVFKVDRLTRSTKDLIDLIDFFNKHNCAFNSLVESIDTNSATGRMFLKIIGIFAEFERENLIERLKLGYARKVKEGYALATYVQSYGYDRPLGTKIQIINPEEAMIVKQIYDMYLNDDYTFTKIAKILNQRKIPTKRDGLWCVTNVRQILENTTYIGNVRHNVRDKEDYEEFEGLHEPIIDKEIFYRVQQKMKTRKKYNRTKYSGDDVYFSGVAVCSECGTKLSPRHAYKYSMKDPTVKFNYLRYRCYHTARGVCLFTCSHNDLLHAFEEYISNIDDIDENIEINSNIENDKEKLRNDEKKSIEEAIGGYQKRLNEIIEQYVNQLIGFDDYKKMTAMIKEKLIILQDRLNSLTEDKEKVIIEKNDIIRNIKGNWDFLDDSERKQFLHRFVDKIVVKREKTGYNKYRIVVENIDFNGE